MSDPNFSDVVLLCHFDGVDATTAFSDASNAARTLTAQGNAQVDTAQSKFGGASVLLDGSGDWIEAAGSIDFTRLPGQFTVELFVRIHSNVANSAFVGSWANNNLFSGSNWFLYTVGGTLRFRISSGAAGFDCDAPWTPTVDTWYHVAADRDASNVIRTYVNGVRMGKATVTAVPGGTTSTALKIGRISDTSNTFDFNGWIDELRITKGVARYATDAGFTPPSVPFPGADVAALPSKGALNVQGLAPTVKLDTIISPAVGALEVRGYQSLVGEITSVHPDTGLLEITGFEPTLIYTAGIVPGAGGLLVQGYKVFVQEHLISEAITLALGEVVPADRVSEATVLALAEVIPEDRFSEAVILTLGEVIPQSRLSEMVVLSLVDAVPCTTSRAHTWKITRRDGHVFAFVSSDVNYIWGGLTYKACKSLNPSASDSSSSLGDVGSMELMGLIEDDSITEADIYAGLFDDAFVEVWSVDYSGTDIPRRLSAGRIGNLSHAGARFNAEVLGTGAKLSQTPLTQTYGPGCRWLFGGPECGVDREALKVAGSVTRAKSRAGFKIDLGGLGPESDRQWADGTIRFLSGPNAGLECEIKSVDFGDETEISLWSSAGFVPEVGDTFELLPGCRRDKATCKDVYDNYDAFGGFPDLPGTDALLQTPDSKA